MRMIAFSHVDEPWGCLFLHSHDILCLMFVRPLPERMSLSTVLRQGDRPGERPGHWPAVFQPVGVSEESATEISGTEICATQLLSEDYWVQIYHIEYFQPNSRHFCQPQYFSIFRVSLDCERHRQLFCISLSASWGGQPGRATQTELLDRRTAARGQLSSLIGSAFLR